MELPAISTALLVFVGSWTFYLIFDSLSLGLATVNYQPAREMASSRSLDYLERLPGTVFYKLYQQPATALAIFRRMLPDLGKLPLASLGPC